MADFSGAFERVGNVDNFGLGDFQINLPFGIGLRDDRSVALAWYNDTLYMYSQYNRIYSIDTDTGEATLIGRLFSSTDRRFYAGFTAGDDGLYLLITRSSSDYRLNKINITDTGVTTTEVSNVRDLGIQGGRLLSCITWDGENFYLLNKFNRIRFYRLNKETGRATQIGATNLNFSSINSNIDRYGGGDCIAWDGDNILTVFNVYDNSFGEGNQNSLFALCSIDRTTGNVTRIGTVNYLGFSNYASAPSILGMTWSGDTLYAVSYDNKLYKASSPPTFKASTLPAQIHEGQRLELDLGLFFSNATSYAFTGDYTPPSYLELVGSDIVIAKSPPRTEDETISVPITGTNSAGSVNGVIMITLRPPLPTPAFSPSTEEQSVVSGESWDIDLSTLFTRAANYVFPNDYLVPSYVRLTGSTLAIPRAPDVENNTTITIRVSGQNQFGSIDGSIDVKIVPKPPTFKSPPLTSARVGDPWSYDLTLAFNGATSYKFQDGFTVPSYLSISGSTLSITEVPFVATDSDFQIQVSGVNDGGSVDGVITVRFTASNRPIIGATAPQRYVIGEKFDYVIPVTGDVSDVDAEGEWDGETYHEWDAENKNIHIIGTAKGRVSGKNWDLQVSGPDGQDRRSVIYDYIDKTPIIHPIGTHIVRIGREISIDVVIENSPSRVVVTGSLLKLGWRSVNDIIVPGDDALHSGIRITGAIPETARITITNDTFRVIAVNSAGSVQAFGGLTILPFDLPALTGGMMRIGMANAFGVSETNPRDLAYDPNTDTLYMLGADNNRIYTLDKSTGEGTLLGGPNDFSQGSNRNFSAGVQNAYGIAFDSRRNFIYMTDISSSALYRVDPMTSVATRVSGAQQFFAVLQAGTTGETSPRGIAYNEDNGLLYMVGQRLDFLSVLDTTTGTLARVGNVNGFGVGELLPEGLTYNPNKNVFYMTGRTNNAMYEVSPTTGMATRIGNISNFGVNERMPTGLAFDEKRDILYFTGATNDALYTAIREVS